MLVTIYGADGDKQRKAVGYTGGACNRATQPYEAREIRGTMKKTPTDDACLPDSDSVEVDDRLRTEG